MDKAKVLNMVRSDVTACAEMLSRAVANYDTVPEMEELGTAIQSARQVLQACAFTLGKALQSDG